MSDLRESNERAMGEHRERNTNKPSSKEARSAAWGMVQSVGEAAPYALASLLSLVLVLAVAIS